MPVAAVADMAEDQQALLELAALAVAVTGLVAQVTPNLPLKAAQQILAVAAVVEGHRRLIRVPAAPASSSSSTPYPYSLS